MPDEHDVERGRRAMQPGQRDLDAARDQRLHLYQRDLHAGQWLDRKLGTAPWLLIIGVFTGATRGREGRCGAASLVADRQGHEQPVQP